MSWRDGELRIGNGLISRVWKFVDGLPVPVSLVAYGKEWLAPDGLPGMAPPDSSLKTPVKMEWRENKEAADPAEASSRQGALTVTGADGRGYRWHFQVFENCPAITCRVELLGPPSQTQKNASSIIAASEIATGIEKEKKRRNNMPGNDFMEYLPLAGRHFELAVADLQDRTDSHDNLASERRWRLGPVEKVTASTCLAAIENPSEQSGLALLKHAPLPNVRPVKNSADVLAQERQVWFLGHGAGDEGQGYSWSIVAWQGGRWERAAVLHQLQMCFRPYVPGRDGLMLSNTWGDRSRDSRITESFVRQEIAAGAAMGVDVCEVDDGWQKGVSANSAQNAENKVWNGFWAADHEFWKPDPVRFPNGLDRISTDAKAKKMEVGLWFAPDSSNDFGNWEKDAAVILNFYRQYGIRFIKVDGVKLTTKASEINLQRFFAKVRAESRGSITIDLDVTAENRPGYFGAMQAGPIFLENRYTDWGSWWPHATLRNLWELSWFIPPQRLRIEFLNPCRNADKYKGSPLAPMAYPADYPFATAMAANPLAWFEVSNLPPGTAATIGDLSRIWRQYRDEMHQGTTLPIGECPSGAAWTGFCSLGSSEIHVLVFRELTRDGKHEFELPVQAGNWAAKTLAGTGHAIWRDGRLHVEIPERLHWLWVRLTPEAAGQQDK